MKSLRKTKKSWTQNLAIDVRRRRDMLIIELLSNYTRLPPRKHIIVRYHTLLEHSKGIKARLIMIAGELISLWLKFSFPSITKQTIILLGSLICIKRMVV